MTIGQQLLRGVLVQNYRSFSMLSLIKSGRSIGFPSLLKVASLKLQQVHENIEAYLISNLKVRGISTDRS